MILGLFFDLSRAFDMVDHRLLLMKLDRLGVRGSPQQWLRSYLTGRTNTVVINGARSDSSLVTRGTPQGSILSPTLFNVFINDLPAALSEVGLPVLYADDTSVIITAVSQHECFIKANASINIMTEWCRLNGLRLNASKSVAVMFGPKNQNFDCSVLLKSRKDGSIMNATNTKFLGIVIDQKLTFGPHVEKVTATLSSCCFLLRSLRPTVSLDVLRLTYFGLFQSTLSYGIAHWGRASDARQMLVLQKKAIRCMIGVKSQRVSCRQFFKDLSILTFPSLYMYSVVIYAIGLRGAASRGDVHSYNTRGREEFDLPFCRLAVSQNNPRYMGLRLFNHLRKVDRQLYDVYLTQKSAVRFRRGLKNLLIDKCYYSVDEFFADG